MSIFYFDVYDGLSGPDRVGEDCRDLGSACQKAARRVARLMTDQADWFGAGQMWQIGIANAEGRLILVLEFGSASSSGALPDLLSASSPVFDPMLSRAASRSQPAI